MKGERMAKRSSFGSIVRKRLSDITNSQSQPKLVTVEEKQPSIANSTEDLINQLLMEKATLMKLVEDRDKIIAVSNNQLRNLKTLYQKLQLQNWNLAHSNSQMLALEALQHELVCKDALLKAKNMRLQGKADISNNNPNSVPQEGEKNIARDCIQKANNGTKSGNRIRRRTARTIAPSTTCRQGIEKEKLENKRRCLRRQSARFKSQEREPKENLFEIEDLKFSISQSVDNPIQEDGLKKETLCELRNEAPRSSFGRPVRRAAEKVQSYKELPLNVKMRREE
ncbi:hypothetical protein JCGZ_08290 [Jatropha curcas]|uniref:Shugoshin C-terminal domain-containing protein n=1 Tax=Jatropha curcas TaxID=180498 RepID=A0A067L008_JATCU|nr:hypothetical protein JCGZ_08290 [Jatropha curcas]